MILRIRIVTNLLNVFLVFWVMKANKRCPGPPTHHPSLLTETHMEVDNGSLQEYSFINWQLQDRRTPLSCFLFAPFASFCIFVNLAFLILRPCLLNHQKLKGILPIITFPFFFNEPLLFHQCFSRASVRSFALWHVVDQFLPMLKRYTLQKTFTKIDYSEDLDQVV